MTTPITFVTAFINIYENRTFDDKDINWRFRNFETLAKSGIYICVYTDEHCYDKLNEIVNLYPNVKMMKKVDLDDTFVYNTSKELSYDLPPERHQGKDSDKFMFLQNSKIEFMSKVILYISIFSSRKPVIFIFLLLIFRIIFPQFIEPTK